MSPTVLPNSGLQRTGLCPAAESKYRWPDENVGVIERYDRFWAEYLGVDPSDWSRPGLCVNAHTGLKGYRGVWFFARGERMVISAPPGWVDYLRRYFAAAGWRHMAIEESLTRTIFGDAFDRHIGPAFQGSLDPDDFRPVASLEVRLPTADDSDVVDAFASECGEAGWDQSGLAAATLYKSAFFEGSRVVAMAAYRAWNDGAGDPCVLTHPAYRRRGCGAAVVSATVECALAEQKLLLYQTLESNTAAIKLARQLGYQQYAMHIAVRLLEDGPSNSCLQRPG
jgi:GNAT superfamily N-acetyltransferase